jgi:calcium homeostasis ER protein
VSHLLVDSKVDVTTLEQICNRIVQSCSRDAIQTGKNFVFTKHLPDEKQVEATCFYLKQRILNEDITGESRLHLVYFMNELLSHAHKNKIDLIKKQMEKVIIPCFCQTALTLDKEKSPKIDKLLDIWEKTKYFPISVLDMLKKPTEGMKFYEDKIIEEKQQIIQTIEEDFNNQFKQLENQHKEFVNHAQGQINKLHGQIAQIQCKLRFYIL